VPAPSLEAPAKYGKSSGQSDWLTAKSQPFSANVPARIAQAAYIRQIHAKQGS